MSSIVLVRNLDIEGGNPVDAMRLQIVVDGLTIFDGAQLAVDTTMVSPLQRDGTARRRAADHDGAALEDARRRKERTRPELSGERGRGRLVVLGAEVGGRWSGETAEFLGGIFSRVCARKHPGRSAQGVVASMAKSVELHSGEGFRHISSGAKDFSRGQQWSSGGTRGSP